MTISRYYKFSQSDSHGLFLAVAAIVAAISQAAIDRRYFITSSINILSRCITTPAWDIATMIAVALSNPCKLPNLKVCIAYRKKFIDFNKKVN